MLKRSVFVFALLATAASVPVRADDLSGRVDQMEEQIRQLTGQVEQLTYQLKQLQVQRKLGAADTGAPVTTDQAQAEPQDLQQSAQAAPVLRKKPASAIQQPQVVDDDQGVETIGETPIQPQQMSQSGNPQPASGQMAQNSQNGTLAPSVRPLGTTRSAASNDGGFQGKVLVAPGGMVVATATDTDTINDNSAAPMTADDNSQTGEADQQVASAPQDDPVPAAETPDDLFLRSEKALLQLQYANAQEGFREFITKYPDHNLAGSAEFKLGETYWAQQNFSSAAQAYLDSYKKYPKGRRAPDSLLKLGLSLARLGQKDQACATIGSVDTEYPNAVDVKKRAQAEFKRAGC